jgi:hypothetical protein
MNILWIASNNVLDSPFVRISLYKDSLPIATVASSAPNNGAFTYPMHKLASGSNYRIKISTVPDTAKFDFGGYFSIYSDYSGTITITYPNASSLLTIGNSDTIRWKTTEFPGIRLRLDLYCDTVFVSTIVEAMATTLDKYPWGTIATPLGTSGRYRIKVTSENDESISSYSDYFTIASIYTGGFVIKAPAAATVWPSGYNYSILWDTTGSPGPFVSLQLYIGQTPFSTIAAGAADNGTYLWQTQSGMTTDSTYRIKITSARDAGLFAFSSPFRITGVAADRYEPDNRRPLAHSPVLDTFESHTITWSDTDWVSFSADSGSSYLILSRCQGLFQISCALFPDTASASVAANASSAAGTIAWLWPCPKSGRYFGRIVPATGVNSGEYSFKVSRFKPASLVSFSAPLASAHIAAGTTVTVQWAPDSLIFGPAVQLYLYKGTVQVASLSSKGLKNFGSYDWAIAAGFASGSDYSLRLVNAMDNRLYGQGPTFSIDGMAPDSFENDDSRARASDLTMGKTQQHSISYNDTDWIRFSATTGSRYIVLVKCADTFQASFSLFPDTGSQSYMTEATPAHGALSTMWTCPAGAVYYGRIAADSAGTFGTYTVTIFPFDSLTALTFTAPAASSILVTGTPATIAWLNDPVICGDSVSIILYKGNTQLSMLAPNLPSSAPSFAWNISDSLKPGNDYRIKVANAAKSSFCGFGPKFIISDVAPDAYEPDGTPAKASRAVLDSLQQHTITYNDTDCIQFTADSGSLYVLSVIGAASLRTSGTLQSVSSATQELSLVSNASGQSNTVWTCKKSGTYFVKIYATLYGATGAYAFKARIFDPQTIAAFIAPAPGAAWSVDSLCTIRWNANIDLFGSTVALTLYSGQTQLFPIVASTSNSGSYAWKIPFGLVSGAEYRIRLASFADASLYGFSSAFTLVGTPPDAYEPDNSWSQAHGYTLGTLELHNITYNDTDWIKFAVDSGTRYLARVNGADAFRTTISFYYENNWNGFDPFVANASGGLAAIWQCNKSTTAYVRMNSAGSTVSSTGAYSISIDKFDSSKTVAFISPQAGASFTAGNAISVQWTPDTGFLGQTVTIALLKGNMVALNISSVANTGKLDFSVAAGSVITGSDYRFRITNVQNGQFCGYGPSFSITGIDAVPDGYEVDDTPAAARPISLGSVQQHNLILNDVDWIVFQMTAGQQYVLCGDQASGNSVYAQVHVGSPTAPATPLEFSVNTKILRKPLAASMDGPCYIQLYSTSSNVYQTYSFRVVQFDTAKAITITSPTEGMTVKAGQGMTITWVCDSSIVGRYVTLYLYRGNSLAGTYYSNNEGSFTWDAAGAISGSDYRFKIVGLNDPSFSAYSPVFTVNGINVDAFEPDNTPGTASVIAFGTAQQHNLYLSDTDWVKIPAQSGYKYLFEYTDATVQIRANYFDSSRGFAGSSSFYFDLVVSTPTTSLWTCTKSGAYYLQIIPLSSSSTTGNYTVRITQFDTSENIKILTPTAGTVWTAGALNTATWIPDEALYGSVVTINVYKGNKFATSITGSNTGNYSWILPLYVENGTDYNIEIARRDAYMCHSSPSQNFTITGGLVADSYEPDNVKSTAKLITLGETQHHTLPANDTDYVKFQADSGATYTFQDSTSSSKLSMIIMSSDSYGWVKQITGTAGQSSAPWTCAKTDTYYVQITVYSSMFGNGTPGVYSLTVMKQ